MSRFIYQFLAARGKIYIIYAKIEQWLRKTKQVQKTKFSKYQKQS